MIRRSSLLLTLGLVASALVAAGPETAKARPGVDPANLDTSVKACEDFYQFANGGWLKAHTLPADKSRYGAFEEVADFNREVLHIEVDTSISSARLIRIFEQLKRDHGLPQVLCTDNGPEFLGEAFVQWAKLNGMAIRNDTCGPASPARDQSTPGPIGSAQSCAQHKAGRRCSRLRSNTPGIHTDP